ncbi:phage major capsid protein [Mycolicibacterium pulveris]|uniref:phage major capsid protein n=1 Tax=Mycolicibacterium pulveris TaxID=36813 RepID=UPI003CF85028
MAIQTTSGVIVQEAVQKILVQPLEQMSTWLSSGVTIVDSSEPVRIPVIEPGTLPTYVAQGDLIPDNAVNWSEVEALPSSLLGIAGWYPISNQAVRSTAVTGLPSVVQQRILTDASNKLDRCFYVGDSDGVSAVQTIDTSDATDGTFTLTYKGQTTAALDHDDAAADIQTALRGLSTIGASNVNVTGSAGAYTVTFAGALANTQVEAITIGTDSLTGPGSIEFVTQGIEAGGIDGLFNQPGTQQAELDTADLDSFLDAIAVAAAANVEPNRWYLNPVDHIQLRKIHKGNDDVSYVLDPDPRQGTVYTLFGIPVTTSNFIPRGKAALGATQYAIVVRDLNPEVFVTEHALAQRGALALRVSVRMDMVLSQPGAWVILSES